MKWYILAPVILSFIVTGAHFLRSGNILTTVILLGIPFLLMIQKRISIRLVQLFLFFSTVTWLFTTLRLINDRISTGSDWIRMSLILGTVAVIPALAILLLNKKSILDKYSN